VLVKHWHALACSHDLTGCGLSPSDRFATHPLDGLAPGGHVRRRALAPLPWRTLVLRNVGTTLVLLVVLASGAVALFAWNARQLTHAHALVDHTHEVLGELEGLRTSVAHVESAMRGFVLTGDPRFLPSAEAEAEPDAHLSRLRQLIADNPDQIGRLSAITPIVEARLAHAHEAIRLRREQGLSAAQAQIAKGEGSSLSAEIERRIRELAQAERDLLESRTRQTAQVQSGVWVIGGLLIFLVATIALAAFLTTRQQRVATERAEAKSHEAEQRFRLLVESVTDHALYLLDPDGNLTSWNPGAQRLKGYSAGEIVGHPLATFFTAEDRARGVPQKELLTAEREGRAEGEGWRVRKDGSRFWANFILTAIRDASGRLKGFAKVTRDVTERKRLTLIGDASNVLLSSGDYRANLARVAELCVPFLGDWAAIQLVEDGALEMTAIAHADPAKVKFARELNQRFPESPETGLTWRVIRERKPTVIPEIVDATLDSVAAGGEHRRLVRELGLRSAIIVPLVGRDRVLGALTLVAAESPRRYGDGELAMATELAQRCATAIENARAHAAVELERRFLDATLRQLREGVVVVESSAGGVLLANDAALRILRLPESKTEAVMGQLAYDVAGRPVPSSEWPISRALRHGVPVPEMELVVGHNGDRTIISVGAAPVKDQQGRTVAAVASFRDITERKRAEQRAVDEAKFRELFIGILAHDLRNPINAISTASQLLSGKGLGPAESRTVGRIASAADRMAAMVSDLLDLTRARLGGGIPLSRAQVELREVCQHVVEELALAYPAARIEFDVQGDTTAEADRARIAQVVSNLVGNAVAYGGAGPVRVSLGEGDGAVELRVHNDGEPIAPELLPVIFDPFRRGETFRSPEQRKGLGLGLFIANEVVKSHGGSIQVTSDREHGTTFRVVLPRVAHAASPVLH
jgi:PAS domain S-box-containing protein